MASLSQQLELDTVHTARLQKTYGMAITLENLINKAKSGAFRRLRSSGGASPLEGVEGQLQVLQARLLGEGRLAQELKNHPSKGSIVMNSLVRENCQLRVALQKAEKVEKELQRQLGLSNEQR